MTERALDDATIVVADCPPPSPSPPPPVKISSPPPPPLAPRAVRRLTMDKQQAANCQPSRSPSLERAASPSASHVGDQVDASAIARSSLYTTEENMRIGPLPGHEVKIRDWLRNVKSGYTPDDLSPYPTPPAAPRKDQYVSDSDSEYGRPRRRRQRSPPLALLKNGQLFVRKDYEGRLPLCYYATGLQEGGPDDVYACFDKRDIA